MWVIMFFIFAGFRDAKLITLCFLACCIVQGIDFYFDYLIRDKQLTMVTTSVDFYEKIAEVIKNANWKMDNMD